MNNLNMRGGELNMMYAYKMIIEASDCTTLSFEVHAKNTIQALQKAARKKINEDYFDKIVSIRIADKKLLTCPTCNKDTLHAYPTGWKCGNCGQDKENYEMLAAMDEQNEQLRDFFGQF